MGFFERMSSGKPRANQALKKGGQNWKKTFSEADVIQHATVKCPKLSNGIEQENVHRMKARQVLSKCLRRVVQSAACAAEQTGKATGK